MNECATMYTTPHFTEWAKDNNVLGQSTVETTSHLQWRVQIHLLHRSQHRSRQSL